MSDEEADAAARIRSLVPTRGWLAGARFGLAPVTWRALLAVTAVALLARLVGLGYRPMHFDEGRVAYWALRYAETGHFEYRYIIHGPLIQHVDRWLFVLLGANDYVARLPVAVIGGLLPLSVVLYRDHLRESELVALAVLVAVNPILLYYSRFMRSDVLVAAFMFAALGLVVRLHATRRPRYLHAAAAMVALGFASKENAVVYLLAWGGAAALLVDTELYRPRSGGSGLARLRAGAARLRTAAGRRVAGWWAFHGLGAVGVVAVLTLLLFAPRAGAAGGLGLWSGLVDGTLPFVVLETAWDITRGLAYWFGGATETRCFENTLLAGYVCFLERFLQTMLQFAAPLVALAAVGLVYERWVAARSRNLVQFAGYWGVASVLGYPLGMDIWAAWPITHALVPLAIPAAVAGGGLLRLGVAGVRDGRPRRFAVAATLVVAVVGASGAMAVESSFLDARERDGNTDMVQYAQPSGDMRPGLRAMRAAVAGNEGLDVLYYGDRYYLANEAAVALPPPRAPSPDHGTGGWFHRLPLPWYTQAFGAEVASARNETQLAAHLERSPPVVIVQAWQAADVAERLEGYERYRYDLRAHVDGPGRATTIVIFVRTES